MQTETDKTTEHKIIFTLLIIFLNPTLTQSSKRMALKNNSCWAGLNRIKEQDTKKVLGLFSLLCVHATKAAKKLKRNNFHNVDESYE